MELKTILKLAWENRNGIIEGFYNAYISHDADIKAEAARRKLICESNVCGHYDINGKPETSVVPGKPACDICHCNIEIKTNTMSHWCALKNIELPPLWEEVTTEEQEKGINEVAYKRQFEKKN